MIKAIETVTVVNHTLDGDDDIFRCTVVRGASWYWQNNVSVSESGLNSARLLKCRIPAGNVPEGLTVKDVYKRQVQGSLQLRGGKEDKACVLLNF